MRRYVRQFILKSFETTYSKFTVSSRSNVLEFKNIYYVIFNITVKYSIHCLFNNVVSSSSNQFNQFSSFLNYTLNFSNVNFVFHNLNFV